MKTEKQIKEKIYKLNDDILYNRNALFETNSLTKSNVDALNNLIMIDQARLDALTWVLKNE